MKALIVALGAMSSALIARPGVSVAQALEFASADGQARALVEADQASDIAQARRAGADVSVFTVRTDLNGDARPEIIAQISSAYLCLGAGGCPLFVYQSEAGAFRRIGQDMGDGVDVLDRRTQGWRDLRIVEQNGSAIWRWNGREYVALRDR